MAKYKLKGARFLRKYTATAATPVYAAATDAENVVDSMCDVPWESAGADQATMTSHSDDKADGAERSGLDQNVIDRDLFDAALFCAGHSGGKHRAYANAACYRYELPAAAIGKTLTELAAKVTSDPYNSKGARLHIFTNSTGVIPMNCHTLRGEDASGDVVEDGTTAAEVAPRTVETVNRSDYWYPTTETAALSPTGGLVLQKYLFLVVALESYSTVRGNWLEGCSFIKNAVEVTLSAAVDGWDADAVNDVSGSDSAAEYAVMVGGAVPEASGEQSAAFRIVLQRTGDALPDSATSTDGLFDPAALKTSATAAQSAIGLRLLYAALFEGRVSSIAPEAFAARPGAAFSVASTTEMRRANPLGLDVAVPVWKLTASALLVPFATPTTFKARRVRLSWSGFTGSPTAGMKWRVWLKRGAAAYTVPDVTARKLYLTDGGDVEGFQLVGEIAADGEATSATFTVAPITDCLATIMVTGYVSMDAVNPSADSALWGCAVEFKPDISLLG